MLRYYREKETGDYLLVDWNSPIHRSRFETRWQARATCQAKNIYSINTTSIDKGFLRFECKAVAKRNVPSEWLERL